jgi:hypothetical protein
MLDFQTKAAEIEAKLQAENITPSTRVTAKFCLWDGIQDYVQPVQILPTSVSSAPNLAGAGLVEYVMNRVGEVFLTYTKTLQVRDVQVDIQKPPS